MRILKSLSNLAGYGISTIAAGTLAFFAVYYLAFYVII
ncbi:hypothetical protein PHOBOS_129 [Erwinia phage vB_EamM_Phobos]|nr:hypothetical protein BIZ79_gp129 [Erwinia phage vB_EamM_Phobos]ANZ50319.1 hypothetical protein PHOBOS_129 [Erwinia phage vB_EamM_Phobos]